MLIVKILLGIVGLGVVVFVHELGHFLAARLMKIDVEAFSIGWGKPILKKKIGAVEYRLGLFPLGGYCKMKGADDFQNAYGDESMRAEKGSYLAAHPFSRAFTCIAGPLFNLVFAVLVLTVIWGIGFEVNTLSNRIVMLSDIDPSSVNPADEAGLKTGDRIIEIDGRRTETFNDIHEIIGINPQKDLPILVERDGQLLRLTVRPNMERSSGAGRIGVYFWTDPVIEKVAEGSPAAAAGLESGDIILRVSGTDLPHTMALVNILQERNPTLTLDVLRKNQIVTIPLIPVYNEDGAASLGISWQAVRYQTPRLSLAAALIKGVSETWKTFTISIRSLTLLFRGVDLTRAVSGPIRITYMFGDVEQKDLPRGSAPASAPWPAFSLSSP